MFFWLTTSLAVRRPAACAVCTTLMQGTSLTRAAALPQGDLASDPHKLMLARLHAEHKERKRLAAQLAELQARKAKIVEANAARQETLDRLPSLLSQILEVAAPIGKIIGGVETELIPQDSPARVLPTPLYVLYAHTAAYRDSGEHGIEVSVAGDVHRAKGLLGAAPWNPEDDAEKDADDEAASSRKDGASDAGLEARRQKLMEVHPMSVDIAVDCGDSITVTLQFQLLHNLNVVTCTSRSSSEVKVLGGVLESMYVGDAGGVLPHAQALYKMDSLGFETPFSAYVDAVGRPFGWAQRVCGLEALALGSDDPRVRNSRQSLVQVLNDVKGRVRTTRALAKQLASLALGKVVVPNGSHKLFPLEARAKVKSCSKSSLTSEVRTALWVLLLEAI